MKICIIGSKGNIGRFYSKILKEHTLFKIGRENNHKLEEKSSFADVILLALPLGEIDKVLERLKKVVKKEQVVLNLSSLMRTQLDKMEELPCGSAFLHGLFAPNISSLKKAKFILVSINSNKNLKSFKNVLEKKGAHIQKATPNEHDRAMAVIQALNHFNGILLAKTVASSSLSPKDIENYSTLFSRLYFDAISRIFSQSPETYINLQFNNEFFREILNKYEDNLKELKSIVEKKDYESYEQVFEKVKKSMGKYLQKSFEESKNIVEMINSKKTKIALLGPRGSFTEEALDNYEPECEKMFFENIKDIVSAVKTGMADYGFVPLENSIGGTIAETIDLIYEKKLNIEKTIVIPVTYCAAGLSKKPEVEVIMGHKQAFVQCSEFIEKNYPYPKKIHTLSNSEAFKKIEQNNLVNAIGLGSEYAAKMYNLNIIKRKIENNPDNKTRFALLSKSKNITPGKKSSVVIDPGKDRPGLLFDLLKHFKENSINLCRIESRPSKEKLGAYIFHVEFDGNIYDNNVQKALKNIKKDAKVIYLGSYDELEIKNEEKN